MHKQADELPKKDFIKRYGKDGDAIRYATATSQVKKKLGLGENRFKLKGELKMNESYKQRLDSAMGHLGINSLGELNPEEHKSFFAYVDNLKEGLSAAQKKLPPALQKAIAAKQGDKKETEEEELTPKQKQLDKDKDGDIGADDLAKLRATKKESVSSVKPEVTVKDSNKTAHLGGDKKEKKDADMSKVNDSQKPKEGIKKVLAIKQVSENKRYLQTKAGSLEEAVLISRGLIQERRYMVSDKFDSTGGNYYDLYVVVDAANEKAAITKAESKIEKLRNSSLASKIGIDDPSGDDPEIAEVDTKKPLSWTDIEKDISP